MVFHVDRATDHRFELIGELDMATADQLSAELEPALQDGSDIRLDASQLTFTDSSGIHTLANLCNRCTNGGQIVLERPTRQVAKVLELVGADSIPNLVIHRSTQEPQGVR
jgi:anti-sigma B factor antagonist